MDRMIKGVVLASRKSFVLERFGEAGLARIIGSLPEKDRELLDGIVLPAGWYPLETTLRFDAAIVAVMGMESERALRELGRESASQNLAKLHAGYVRAKNPMTFLEQTPAIYRQYYGTGWRDFVATGPRSGVITTHDAEGVTEADCFTVIGWHEKALEMVGAIDPVITHPVCRARGGAVCRYEVAWK